MTSLEEVEAAAETLALEQKRELFCFLAARLEVEGAGTPGAKLVQLPGGTLVLEAPPGSPPMTTEQVKKLLRDFP